MAGEVYAVIGATEAAQPLPRGLYTLEQEEGAADAALVPTLGSRRVTLSKCNTSQRDDGDVDLRAVGYRLRLRLVGRARLTVAEWEEIKARYSGRSAELARLPAGSSAPVTISEVELLRGGAIIRYRERGRPLASLQLTANSFAAFKRGAGLLEVRTAQGTGLRLRLRDCARCGARLDNARAQELDGVEHCVKCGALLSKQTRSVTQKRVGICRGCLFYGLSSGQGPRVGTCLNATRVKALGQLTESPVLRCAYRRARPAGAPRRRAPDPVETP